MVGYLLSGMGTILFLANFHEDGLFLAGLGLTFMGYGGKAKMGFSVSPVDVEAGGGIVMMIVATLIASGVLH